MDIKGRRLADTPMGDFPLPYDDLQPGDYWFVQTRDGSRLFNVKDHPEDREFWGNIADEVWAGNLTGHVLYVMDPLRRIGALSIHTVRLENDGTGSVRPDDGSSNSILIKRRKDEESWHGFIEHGNWSGNIEPPEEPATA